jgi:uncharacterized RDD family membrane protein YckC
VPNPTPNATVSGPPTPSLFPGERLGFPEHGHMSVGRPGRRIGALAIDWAVAYALAVVFYQGDGVAITLIFAALQVVFIPTIGGSIGHRLVGLRLIALRGGWIGVWRPVVRTILLILVIPAGVWDSDQRGFHDKIAGTVLLRM